MKKTYRIILAALLFLSINQIAYSQTNPTYTLIAKNFNRSAADSLTFDVYMLHTNPSATNFEYALGQYFFKFNPNIANGGTLTYRIIDSGLPVNARPRNPSVASDELRLASNAVIGAGSGPAISSTSPGTLIVKMSLKTSASSLSQSESLNLQWKNSNQPAPFTKVFAYIGVVSTEITTPSTHLIDLTNINQISSEVPVEYKLSQNYPNPFNPETKINFALPKAGAVSLKVYDIQGREIINLVNEKLAAGKYEYKFNASGLSSGIYFYTINANEFIETRKMVILK